MDVCKAAIRRLRSWCTVGLATTRLRDGKNAPTPDDNDEGRSELGSLMSIGLLSSSSSSSSVESSENSLSLSFLEDQHHHHHHH